MSIDTGRQFEATADDFLQTLGYFKDISKHLESRRVEIDERGEYFNEVNYIDKKISKSEHQLEEIENNLEEQKKCLENQLININRKIVTDTNNTRPSTQDAQEEVEKFKQEVKKDQESLMSLLKEKEKREKEKMEFKLLKNILPVQFDPDSTIDNIHGFVKRDDETVELFSFDMNKCNKVDVPDFFWGNSQTKKD